MPKEHSAVCYIFKNDEYIPQKAARNLKNEYGLDLFQVKNMIYEGHTGLHFGSVADISDSDSFIRYHGGLESLKRKVSTAIEAHTAKYGLSPRYTRPNETKTEIFPKQKDENIIYAEDSYGKKHYYYRFYNENGIELYTRSSDKEYFATVYVQCEGYMLAFDQKHRLDEILQKLSTLEGDVRGEVERLFNKAISENQYADLGFARILGRLEEAKEHNAPILQQRELEYIENEKICAAETEAERIQKQKDYEKTISEAENNLISGKKVENSIIQGKSLLLHLFREHNIDVPLRTQGWINHSLVWFTFNDGHFQAYCNGRMSDSFMNSVIKLHDSVLTKKQYQEYMRDTPNEEANLAGNRSQINEMEDEDELEP